MKYLRTLLIIVVLFGFTGFKDSGMYLKPYPFPELRFFPEMPYSVDNLVTVEGAELGRYLFYDPILSADSTFSCASCHRQEVAFSDSPNRFSTGIDSNPTFRHSMPLFNLAWYPAMFWDGRASGIEEQVFHPLQSKNEMDLDWPEAAARIFKSAFYKPMFEKVFGNAEIDSLLIAKAIAQFERTLISCNSKYDKVLRGEAYFTSEEYEGFLLMNDQSKGNCLHCHTTDGDALATSATFSNNGLDPVFVPGDYTDKGKGGVTMCEDDMGVFKIPSLRNISVTGPYMHDGRFQTLEDVLEFYSEGVYHSANIDHKMAYSHQGGVNLTKEETKKIIIFLNTLTDSSFLSNPGFSNPFISLK